METNLKLLSRITRERALDEGLSLSSAISGVLDDRVERGLVAENQESLIRNELHRNLSGFAFLQPYLDDADIEEVWINRPGEIWVAKNGEHQRLEVEFTSEELQTQLERLIRASGRRLDRTTPFVDAQLGNGYRLHAVIPDITREHASLNIRKFSKSVIKLDDLVSGDVLTRWQSEYLQQELNRGANVLISGATQAGKTTLLSALISSLKTSERVVSVEDTFELRCLLPDWVALQTRPASSEGRNEIDLRRLVRETLRMRPTRLVVGEVRGAEALDMLIAMNSGIPGLCTLHANSTEEAVTKIQTLPLRAGGNISSEFLTSVIKSSLNLFVHCERTSSGQRKIASIMKLSSALELSLEAVQF
jgi:pilus assembly protein CpaF